MVFVRDNGDNNNKSWELLTLCQALCLGGFILFFIIYLFLIGGQLLYNIVLVSAIHQHESAIGIHIPLSLEPPSHL